LALLLEVVSVAEPTLFIGLERELELVVLALIGVAGLLFAGRAELPLIGDMVPKLLGIVMPAPEAPEAPEAPAPLLPLPLLPLLLLPEGTKEVVDAPEEGKAVDCPAASSMLPGTLALGLRGRGPRRPMP